MKDPTDKNPNLDGDSVTLYPGVFDVATAKWGYAEESHEDTVRDTLTFATFNIWFGDYYAQERYAAITHLLETHRPDFIALQEVTPDALVSFLNQRWIRQEYLTSDIDGSTLGDYGVLLLSRLPIRTLTLMPLPSFMNRHLLLAEVGVNGSALSVATVHLESLRHSADMRGLQLETIFRSLEGSPNALVMGDFNFCASWPEENDRIDPAYHDLWDVLRGDEPGYTEDTSINRMRYLMKGKHKHVRFDRILLKSQPQDSGWVASSIELLGTEPVSSDYPNVFPSDHFGLLSRISKRNR